MKCYIQNGCNKRVLVAKNLIEGAKTYLKELTKDAEKVELGAITFVSELGFMEDFIKANMDTDTDNIQMIRTSKIMDSIKRKDIGNFLRSAEKKLPQDVKRLVNSL